MTRTGTTVKSFHNDVISVTIRSHLGDAILQLINLTIVIPAVITTNTIASVTDKADVNLNESATKMKKDEKTKTAIFPNYKFCLSQVAWCQSYTSSNSYLPLSVKPGLKLERQTESN